MTAKRVYIVIKRDYETGSPNFRDVFFSIEAAQKYISERRHPREFEIECFEETENGKSKEIYE
jgi:hypothetical protein